MKKENNKDEIIQESLDSKELTVKKNKEKIFHRFINMLKSKVLTNTVGTILLIVVIIDLYILANVVLNKVTLPEFDLTENKVYSLSDETKSKLKNMEDEVTITLINYSENETIIKFAEKYVMLNNKIKIEEIKDLASRKDIMEEYSLDATSSLIVIKSGEKETTLGEWDLYTYDYATYETIDRTEEAITNAIVEITTKNKPKIYFMSNHVAYQADRYFGTIKNSMKEDANEVETIDILTNGSIPEDCDTLVITTLKEDITEFERDEIIRYINKGGEILILNGADITGKNLPNYQAVLNQYGITLEQGVIFEGETSNMLYGYPDFIIEKVQSSSLTENLNMNLTVCLADAASIKYNKDKAEELKLEFEEIVSTSDKAFKRTNLAIGTTGRTDADSEEGRLVVGAIVNKKIDENNNSKLIIFGNELFASDMMVELSGYQYSIAELYNNEDVVLNSIAHLNEREDTITIRKSFDAVKYTATTMQHNIIMVIIFILPLIIIIAGIIVWQVRRRKK